MNDRSSAYLAAGTFVCTLLLMIMLSATGMYWGESSLLTARAWQLGASHPPGYAGFLHLLHAFQKTLPLGDILYRSNLTSIIALAVASGLMTLLFLKIDVPPIIAVPESIGFAVSLPVLNASATAEVYSLNLMMVLLVILQLIPSSGSIHHAGRAAFLTGIALTHHLTFVFILPGLGWFFFRKYGRFLRLRTGVTLLPILFLLGLSTLLFYPVRESVTPGIVWGDPSGVEGFLTLISAGEEATGSLISGIMNPGGITRRGRQLGHLVAGTLSIPGLVLVIPGAVALWQRHRRMTVCLVSGLICITCAVIIYDSNESASFFLPGLLFLWLLSVAGLTYLIMRLLQLPYAVARWTAGTLKWIPAAVLVFLLIPRAVGVAPMDSCFPGYFARIKSDILPSDTLRVCRRSDICFQNWYLNVVERRSAQETVFQHLLSFRWYLEDLTHNDLLDSTILNYPIEDSRSWNAVATAALIVKNLDCRPVVIMDPEIHDDLLISRVEIPAMTCLPWGALIHSETMETCHFNAVLNDVEPMNLLTQELQHLDPVTTQILIADYIRQSHFYARCGDVRRREAYLRIAQNLQQHGQDRGWW